MFMFRKRRLQNREAQKKSSCATVCSKIAIILSAVIFLSLLVGGLGFGNIGFAYELSIDDPTVDEENGTVTFTVTKSGSGTGTVAVNWTTQAGSGSATVFDDYEFQSNALVFAEADLSKDFTVTILPDALVEADETFDVELSIAFGPGTLTKATGTCTITDNDVYGLSVSDESVDEEAGTVTFTVTKSGSGTESLTVDWASQAGSGSATAGADYTSSSGNLSFAAADTSKSFTVAILPDALVEADETFDVELSNVAGRGTLTKATGTCTITDNDVYGLSVSDESVDEEAGTVTFTVTKSGSGTESLTVDWASQAGSGSATAGADYTSSSGNLSFAAADTSKSFTVAILPDALVEADETFDVELSNVAGRGTLTKATGTCTITDNDVYGLSVSDESVDEEAGTVTFTVTKSGSGTESLTVDWASQAGSGSATAGADYTSSSGNLSFAAADTSKSFTVAILPDALVEADETFDVELSNVAGRGTLTKANGTCTITDNDVYGLSVSDESVDEEAGTVTFTVTKSGSGTESLTVDWASQAGSGSATAGADYTSSSGNLSFAAADTSKSFTVAILPDALVEADETFDVELSNVAGPGNADQGERNVYHHR